MVSVIAIVRVINEAYNGHIIYILHSYKIMCLFKNTIKISILHTNDRLNPVLNARRYIL